MINDRNKWDVNGYIRYIKYCKVSKRETLELENQNNKKVLTEVEMEAVGCAGGPQS